MIANGPVTDEALADWLESIQPEPKPHDINEAEAMLLTDSEPISAYHATCTKRKGADSAAPWDPANLL